MTSPTALRALLACPVCRQVLGGRATLDCGRCRARYTVDDGIPILVADGLSAHDARQASHFDEEVDEAYEIERPLGTPAFHGWLLSQKFHRGVSALVDVLPGATALAVAGGSGLDAELLARAGARPITLDVSLRAARRARERARRHDIELLSVVASVEALPFADRSVDVVYVHDGLHHVERPLEALAEMARVARVAVSVNEPANAALTRAAIPVGLALDREEAGNPVRRLDLDDVKATLREADFEVEVAERYAMLYRHEPGAVSRLLSRRRLLPAAMRAQLLAGRVAGRFGNKLTVQARRRAL